VLQYPSEWESLAKEVLSWARLVILVGAVDTGKSTMTTYLANTAWSLGYKTAVVDADVGQSDIGPPATIGLGVLQRAVENLHDVPPAEFYFVGSTTPRGHIAAAVAGTKRMVERAFAAGARRVIVNTTGLIGQDLGRTLKYYKVGLTRPDAIIGLQRRGELEPMLKTWEAAGFAVYRLPVAPGVCRRPYEVRAAFREQRWREFFAGARRIELPFGSFRTARTSLFTGEPLTPAEKDNLGALTGQPVLWAEKSVHGAIVVTREPVAHETLLSAAQLLKVPHCLRIAPDSFTGIIVGLLGRKGRCLSLGWVERIDYEGVRMLMVTPYRGEEPIRVVEFSATRLDAGSVFGKKREERCGETCVTIS
jgi:polynucleotide 5'-hydroxyl-kinase GRC3/NOL9